MSYKNTNWNIIFWLRCPLNPSLTVIHIYFYWEHIEVVKERNESIAESLIQLSEWIFETQSLCWRARGVLHDYLDYWISHSRSAGWLNFINSFMVINLVWTSHNHQTILPREDNSMAIIHNEVWSCSMMKYKHDDGYWPWVLSDIFLPVLETELEKWPESLHPHHRYPKCQWCPSHRDLMDWIIGELAG